MRCNARALGDQSKWLVDRHSNVLYNLGSKVKIEQTVMAEYDKGKTAFAVHHSSLF